MNYAMLEQIVKPTGLMCRGGFVLSKADSLGRSGSLIMLGNAGPALWASFEAAQSRRTEPARGHPLDDWTRTVVTEIAAKVNAQALYPFDGPPYYPFQQWAQRSEPVFSSPIGPLIHPKFGLWHAYRAALIFDEKIELSEFEKTASPCDTCADQPCLTRCPVAAFRPNRYDVPACISHLKSVEGHACRTSGCLARHACPVGQSYAYGAGQAQFHMEKFVESQTAPSG